MKAYILEDNGYFWWHDTPIPEGHLTPDSSVTGVLRIEENGRIELELDGILWRDDNPTQSVFGNDTPVPPERCIQGLFKGSNKSVLLLALFKNGGMLRTRGISYEKYQALNCLIGDSPFPRLGHPLKFCKLTVDMKGFDEWLSLGSIETNRTKSRISIKYNAPKDISYDLEDGKLSIKYDILGPFFGKDIRRSSLTLSEKASINYAPTKSVTLDEMKTQYGYIEDLLMLLTGSDYRLDWPTLSLGKQKKSYQCFFARNKNLSPPPNRHECWTNFVPLRNDFGQIFSTWRNKHEEFGPGFYLYLGTRRGITLYIEHRFVNLIWGIESLHRRKTAKLPTPSTKIKERMERILSNIEAEEDRKWLEKMLKHKNEPTLENRIFEIFKNVPLDLNDKLLRHFSIDCAANRNQISHFGGQRHKESYSEFITNLNKKCEALSYLYHSLILKEIGVDEKTLNSRMLEGFGSYTIKTALSDAGLLHKP